MGGTALSLMPGAPARATAGGGALSLWYERPAERWLQALPVGNGRLAAMMFGGIRQERLDLSESTLWSGAPSTANLNEDALSHLAHIRTLMFDGRYDEADALCAEHLLGRMDQFGTALPMARLRIDMAHADAAGHYRRWLDLEQGIAGVEYRIGRETYRRTLFASNPDGLIVLKIETDRRGGLDAHIGFADLHPSYRIEATSEGLFLRGQALESLHSDGRHGAHFECRLHAAVDTGSVEPAGEGFRVRGARSLTLLIAASTDYAGNVPATHNEHRIENARRRSYETLRSTHVADHGRLFNRVTLRLGEGGAASALPTDERRRRIATGKAADPDLAALFFHYGRYLTIAGSREDSPLPLALQGIWNDGRAAAMGWADDFHLDINTQQNYWACEVANLPECHAPLWRYLETLRHDGADTARRMYGANGWVAHVYSNPWGFTAPGSGNGWGLFVTGGLWLALDVWDHYRFRPDRRFLKQTAWPLLRDAAAFYLDYMVEHPRHGWLVTGPSISPENAFKSPTTGKPINNSMGPTCDMVLVGTLFDACLEAISALGDDAALHARIAAARDRLPPLRIGRYGQLQEWLEDFEEAQPNHRHTSHLVALYPYGRIDPRRDPALAGAARVVLERRLSQPDWEDTEWTRANLVNYYARLLDGEAAERHLNGLLVEDADDALLTFSRGGIAGADENIFAIDGNTAGAAGIAEMLLQSYRGEIELLPALPQAWASGEVKGLRARGDVEVAMRWQGGTLQAASLRAGLTGAGRHILRHRGRTLAVDLVAGRPLVLNAEQLRALVT